MVPENVIKDVSKNINELPTPWGRILVRVLILSVAVLASVYYASTKGRLEECENRGKDQGITITGLRHEIDSLKASDLLKSEAENQRLKNRVSWQDSIKEVLQGIIDQQRSHQ